MFFSVLTKMKLVKNKHITSTTVNNSTRKTELLATKNDNALLATASFVTNIKQVVPINISGKAA